MEKSIELLQKQYDSLISTLSNKDWASDPDSEYHKQVREEYTELTKDYLKALTILKYENQR